MAMGLNLPLRLEPWGLALRRRRNLRMVGIHCVAESLQSAGGRNGGDHGVPQHAAGVRVNNELPQLYVCVYAL